MKIKRYNEFILNEELPFDSYPGPPVTTQGADYINYLLPDDSDVSNKVNPHFSYPRKKNGPDITRWSGDNNQQLGIKGGANSGRIGGEFSTDFHPGGSVKKNISEPKDNSIHNDKAEKERKRKAIQKLKMLNKKKI
jgi:hypothetical protein